MIKFGGPTAAGKGLSMRKLHRWVGLFIGLWLTLMGASGIVLLYRREIDTYINSSFMLQSRDVPVPDFSRLLPVISAAYPDRTILKYERYGMTFRESAAFALSRPNAQIRAGQDITEEADIEVFVDAAEFRILGVRHYRTPLRQIKWFHEQLLLGSTGKRIVGIMGLLAGLNIVFGYFLWWKTTRGSLSKRITFRLNSKLSVVLRNVHVTLGAVIGLIILPQIITGIMVGNGSVLRNILPMVFLSTAERRSSKSDQPSIQAKSHHALTILPNTARDITMALHEKSDLVLLTFPSAALPNYIALTFPRDEDKTRHYRQSIVDAHTGKKIFVLDVDKLPPMLRVFNAQLIWLHNGYLFGPLHRALLLLIGLMAATFFPTGIIIWMRRRRPAPRSVKSSAEIQTP